MINITEKEIYSWEVIDNSTLIKNCDKTVFAYSQTGIPKELKDFFGYFLADSWNCACGAWSFWCS